MHCWVDGLGRSQFPHADGWLVGRGQHLCALKSACRCAGTWTGTVAPRIWGRPGLGPITVSLGTRGGHSIFCRSGDRRFSFRGVRGSLAGTSTCLRIKWCHGRRQGPSRLWCFRLAPISFPTVATAQSTFTGRTGMSPRASPRLAYQHDGVRRLRPLASARAVFSRDCHKLRKLASVAKAGCGRMGHEACH